MLIENFSTILDEKTEDKAVLTNLEINPKQALFEGHFPGNPVTPGVMLLQLFKEQAERYSGKTLQIVKASNIKFLSVINPEINPKVRLESNFEMRDNILVLSGKAIHQEGISMKLKMELV